jgi:hypothetical protein
LALCGAALGLVASQAGHLLVYALVYGQAAARVQSSGAHAYFPALVKSAFGLAAIFLLLSLVAVGLARLLAGRRLVSAPAPPFVRLMALLFCFQLTCFVVQETIEMAAGAPATSAPALLLWGSVGQLPVAVLAALALRWIAVRVAPAIAGLIRPAAAAVTVATLSVTLQPRPVPVETVPSLGILASRLRRRGPPL